MATLNVKPHTKAGLGAAATIVFFSIIFFGIAIEHVAESAADCMDQTRNIDVCSRVNGRTDFWEPLLLIAGVGFFVGVMCFVYGRQQGERVMQEYLNTNNLKQQKMSGPDVERILHAYAAAILSRKSVISDASELPYPKATIKAALIAALSVTKDPKMREQLKSSFVSLADWQEGVGPGPYPFDPKMKDGEDTLAMAKRIAEAPSSFPEISAKMLAEGRALLDELKALGV